MIDDHRPQSSSLNTMRRMMSFCARICAGVEAGLIATIPAAAIAAPKVVSGGALGFGPVTAGVSKSIAPLAKYFCRQQRWTI
jgi:hypothetical protein